MNGQPELEGVQGYIDDFVAAISDANLTLPEEDHEEAQDGSQAGVLPSPEQ